MLRCYMKVHMLKLFQENINEFYSPQKFFYNIRKLILFNGITKRIFKNFFFTFEHFYVGFYKFKIYQAM